MHRRVEITVEREVVSYLKTSGPEPTEGGERCGHCGQVIQSAHELPSGVSQGGAACAHSGLVEPTGAVELQDLKSQNSKFD